MGDAVKENGYNLKAVQQGAALKHPKTQPMSDTQTEAWTTQKLLQWTNEFFTKKGSDAPRLAAEVLLSAALECQRIDLYAKFNEVPAEPQLGKFRDWVKRHGSGEPVAYLVGHKEFYSLKFNVSSDVLIPRPETEHLVMAALDRISELPETAGAPQVPRIPRIADVGTGSGCIGVTLAKQLDSAEVVATDISPAALAVAASNVELHGVADKVQLVESDLLTALPADQKFDIIVSNPPYVGRREVGTVDENVANFEPDLALFGGDVGTEIIERLIEQAADRLVPGGFLIFELSPIVADQCVSLVEGQGSFDLVELQKDYSGHKRLIVTQRNSV